MNKMILSIIMSLCLLSGCTDYYDTKNDPITYGDTYFNTVLSTDKACYAPGEAVQFKLREPLNNAKVRYSHLGKVLKEENIAGTTWLWTPPTDDFQGYLVDVYEIIDGQEAIKESIGVDVSSDWKKFPRYGFLSGYDRMNQTSIENNINTMNRYHINGIQFYDWQNDHHRPLAGTVESPAESWLDLIGRTNYRSTVDGYINAAHDKGMKAMFYNLLFGALQNAATDGVKEEWYLFKDNNHSNKDNHHLNPPFRSSIYLTNPANVEWQNYLIQRNQDVYAVYDFDGYHIDQLGSRGTLYDYNGTTVKLDETYGSFIAAMKAAFPTKYHVMNAVSQYGQSNSIAPSAVDFLYTEVWDPSKSFDQLVKIIVDNNTFSNNSKNTVLAAYINYAKSSRSGYVNEAGVLLANAVIFAAGGSHLEIGEHYLANEYFPNKNLQMHGELKGKLIHYYDFLVGYQNILRDGGTLTTAPAQQGNIAVFNRKFADKDVFHFLNFTNASTMEWRDTDGNQREPVTQTDITQHITVASPAVKIWVASPDTEQGVAREISFTQNGSDITFTLPSLKYWSMVVVEY
ncbi:MAG: glycoside hydrolase family 66 protein [Prevotellaceae bacterium]|jgi:dextranase|nr:glycoside hydrolase family 66 protein [Prevotellaceae bacterium]